MLAHLTITVLVDNHSCRDDLQREHGLALWIEADDRRILFDTGQSDRVCRNADALGIDLAQADVMILSHGHYDHTGGVAAVLERNDRCDIYGHRDMYATHYGRRPDGTFKYIGMADADRAALQRAGLRVHTLEASRLLAPGIGIVCGIARQTTFEDTGGDFYLDQTGCQVDPVSDDLALYCATSRGVVVVTGCCHAGIVNTLNRIRNLTGPAPLHTVIGGLHLLHAGPARLEESVSALQAAAVQRIFALHCTGEEAAAFLGKRLGAVMQEGGAGLRLTFC